MSSRRTWTDLATDAAQMMLSSAASDADVRRQIDVAKKYPVETGGGVCIRFAGIPAELALKERGRRVVTGDVIGVLCGTDDVLMFSLFVDGGFVRFLDISTTAGAMPSSCERVTLVRRVVRRGGGSGAGEKGAGSVRR